MKQRLLFVLAAAVMAVAPLFAAPQAVPVKIAFAAVVGDKPFACGQSYAGIGTTKSTITVSDFRMFISGVSLIDAAGKATPVALTQDGKWQNGEVALLDFENGTATCSNGTPDVNAEITGTVPAGQYVGLRFDMGLPFDVNHRDPTKQPSPLNLTRLFWNWNGGYKFARIDMKTTGMPQGWVLHLGSTN
ncbi:MAG: metallo-mystery pair system four-Cys motif protein, partial [Acidobacteria bacterium]|nr:metallo-mystery pair system four-Cys motif protein [Acidobacteriota bacterium]